jgi:hypothetical protein
VWLGPAGRAEQQSSAGKSDDAEQQQPDDNEAGNQEGADGYPQMTEKQRRLFELQLKMVRELSHSMSFSSSVPSCL